MVVLYPGLPVLFIKSSSCCINRLLMAIAVSIGFYPLCIYLLNTIAGVPVSFRSSLAGYLFLLFMTGIISFKVKFTGKFILSDQEKMVLHGAAGIFFAMGLYVSFYPFLLGGDPYIFKAVADQVVSTGQYPLGYEPYTFIPVYWAYEPGYPILMSLISIVAGVSTVFSFKYVSLLFPSLSFLVIFLSLSNFFKIKFRPIYLLLILLLYIGTPALIMETSIPRPQIVLSFYIPLMLYLLGKSITRFRYYLISVLFLLLISKFHIFYLVILPVVLLIGLWQYYRYYKKHKFTLIIWTLLIIFGAWPYVGSFIDLSRWKWVSGLFNTLPKFQIDKGYSMLDYVYYLGIGPIIFGVLGTFFYLKSKVYRLGYMLPVVLFTCFLLFVLEVLTRFGIVIVQERFFILLALTMQLITSYGLLRVWETSRNGRNLYKLFSLLILILSVGLSLYINIRNLGGWISRREADAVSRLDDVIPIGSLILTQGNASPMVRWGLPQRYVVGNLSNKFIWYIFMSTDDSEKIRRLNALSDSSFTKLENKLNMYSRSFDILYHKLHISEFALSGLQQEFHSLRTQLAFDWEYIPLPCTVLQANGPGMIYDVQASKKTVDGCIYDIAFRRRYLKEDLNDQVYIVISQDRSKSPYHGQAWWDESSFQDADLEFFDRRKDCFKEVEAELPLRVWKYTGCSR